MGNKNLCSHCKSEHNINLISHSNNKMVENNQSLHVIHSNGINLNYHSNKKDNLLLNLGQSSPIREFEMSYSDSKNANKIFNEESNLD